MINFKTMTTFSRAIHMACASILMLQASSAWAQSEAAIKAASSHTPVTNNYECRVAGNPYLPLWEHLPDGEPRVFADPDNPGKYRFYIIGSHDLRRNSYCGSDIRMWSAPVEDLSQWRDEGPIFTYNIDNQWDVMYAPDLVEVNRPGKKPEYYLFPHSRGARREALVAKSDRPDGPFKVVNASEDGKSALPGSCLGFDPSVYVEQITDKADPDYATGFRAYGYWGFQRSSAAQLDQETLSRVRPGTEAIRTFIPAGARYGVVREGQGDKFPAIYPGQDLGAFNFFEASSIRKVGNKYVMIYSGYSGPDYGIGSSNSTLRYAYGDTPLGPWKIGGVLVDSRAPVLNEKGTKIEATYSGHNTHGSIQQINGQWYVFYHRPPRSFGFARQSMVAPIQIKADEKPVKDGGKVTITGYDPFIEGGEWTAKASTPGHHYTGAEVTSEGFHIFGLNPYEYYSAGIACYLSNPGVQKDAWDVWNNHAPIEGVKNGNIIGYKYFGFGGLDADKLGLKAFAGTKKGNGTAFDLFLTPTCAQSFKIHVMMDGPWANATWKGKKIATFTIPAGREGKLIHVKKDVAQAVEGLQGKHAIYLVAEGPAGVDLFNLQGLGFSTKTKKLKNPLVPKVTITVNGTPIALPVTPTCSTNENGIADNNHYNLEVKNTAAGVPVVNASINSKAATITVKPATAADGVAVVTATYKGQPKIYTLKFTK